AGAPFAAHEHGVHTAPRDRARPVRRRPGPRGRPGGDVGRGVGRRPARGRGGPRRRRGRRRHPRARGRRPDRGDVLGTGREL
ncbi:MAG: hypothetical protein AVDCRST_MAG54-432, partial [uncultured Actinomycetospora sp.]